ncbi:hypothetical protein GXP67_00280 [Rhodocytophaga rosea]|uniref:Uncharacterized protein n=1 Tax=Rhodocytophaga rosea TaxID=2704465 RepID=A0A6C0GBU6_9BACT|nr:hypothetical protein [Rhodocytophaga rosea]QHT65220.1 hypothetical protein GXP67_00280 [Rhodocytophaga rosea]
MEKTPALKTIITNTYNYNNGISESGSTLLLEPKTTATPHEYSLAAFKAACHWYGSGKPITKHPDGYELYIDDPYLNEQQAVKKADVFNEKKYFYHELPLTYKEATPEETVRHLHALLTRINLLTYVESLHNQQARLVSITQYIAEKVLKSKLPFTQSDMEQMLYNLILMATHSDYSTDFPRHRMTWNFPFKLFLRNVKWYSGKEPLNEMLKQYLRDLKTALNSAFGSQDYKARFLQEIKNSIDELLGEETLELFQLHETDTFGK